MAEAFDLHYYPWRVNELAMTITPVWKMLGYYLVLRVRQRDYNYGSVGHFPRRAGLVVRALNLKTKRDVELPLNARPIKADQLEPWVAGELMKLVHDPDIFW